MTWEKMKKKEQKNAELCTQATADSSSSMVHPIYVNERLGWIRRPSDNILLCAGKGWSSSYYCNNQGQVFPLYGRLGTLLRMNTLSYYHAPPASSSAVYCCTEGWVPKISLQYE